MDTVALATYLVQSQTSLAQGQLAATLMNQQQDASDQVVSLLGDAAANAASSTAAIGTGEFLNIIA